MALKIAFAKSTRVAITMVLLHTTANAADSSTHADLIDAESMKWYVELSRDSLDWISDNLPGRELRSATTNLKSDFKKYEDDVESVSSAGFYWRTSLAGRECHLFRVTNFQEIDKTDIVANLPLEGNQSCLKIATILRDAIARYRLALYINDVNSRRTTKLALGPQIFLLNYVLYSDAAQVPQIMNFSAANVLTSGYSVMEGDTLSGIAKALTGSRTNWAALDVKSLGIQEETIDPNASLPVSGKRVYLSDPAAKALLLSSTPGKIYSNQEIDTKWKDFGIQISSGELIFLESMNFHIAKDWASSESDMQFLFWAPHHVSNWKEFEVQTYDPASVANSIYGTSAYEAIVAALCAPAKVRIKGACTLPIFELPADAAAWNWLQGGFGEVSD